MTNFTKLFGVMFKQKRGTAHLLIGIQLLAAFVIAALNWLNHNAMNVYFDRLEMTDFLPQWGIFIISLSFLCQLVFFLVAVSKTQQNCTSQTWRLIPVSDTNFFLIDFASTLISVIYLAFLQLLALGFVFGISFITSKNFHSDFLQELYKDSQIITYNGMTAVRLVELISLVLLLVIVVILAINLVCFCWQLISNAFNSRSNNVILMLCWFFFLFGIFRPILSMFNFLPQALHYPLNFIAGQYTAGVSSSVGILLLIAVILFAINLYLVNKFVEAKANN
ncbi:hypothetical protein OZX69_04975 [Lactobacillus sp. ESL0731]|uniref:hypothetical protein n=1 Tax=unclassified Lactobacillus TaxID=2620435 RepID=UPI0023F75BE6|nr:MULTISPECIES: hypothetical protein [unclassified Lactobacillus]WEV50317.1 hypothetical protein OZX63_04970 [Lactobacillus sp. ESL0700]WEV61446.1 hypothetical protein OZX69_04975 [Lactobacillus sp. ESL0731]